MIEVYSFGYKNKIFRDFVYKARDMGINALIDTRFNPNCFRPFWKHSTLVDAIPFFDMEYYHIKNFGNTKYFEKGKIEILNMQNGIKEIEEISDEWDCDKICLLCTCEDLESCHNNIIIKELLKSNSYSYKGRI